MAQKEHVTTISLKDNVTKELNDVAGKINVFVKDIKKQNKSIINLGNSLKALGQAGGGIKLLWQGFSKLAEPIKKAVSVMKEFEAEWANAEKESKKIDFAANINTKLGTTSTELKNFAGNLANSIRNVFSQDEIQEAMGTMLFDKTGEQIKQILPVAADLATALGTDLKTAVNQLNQSFSGTATQLGRVFPELKQFTKEELEAGKAIDVIKNKVSGLAKEMSDSASGSIKNYKTAMENLREELGSQTTRVLTPMRDMIAKIAENWAEALKKKREYLNSEKAVNEGTGNSEDYKNVIEERKSQLKIAQETLKGYGDSYKNWQYRGRVSESTYNTGVQTQQTRIDELTKEIAEKEKLYNEAIAREKKAAKQAEEEAKKSKQKEEAEQNKKIAEENAREEQKRQDELWNGQIAFWEREREQSNRIWEGFDEIIEKQRQAEKEKEEERKARRDAVSNATFGNMGQLGSVIQAFLEGGKIGGLMEIITSTVQSILQKAQGMSEIIDAVFNCIDTAVDEFIEPVVRILNEMFAGLIPVIKTIGQVIGVLFELLEPVLNVFIKVGKAILTVVISVLGSIYNIIVAIYNLFNKKNKAFFDFSVIDDLWSGADSIASRYGMGGNGVNTEATASASYTAARDIFVTINYNNSYINGDAREIALNIRNEIRTAEALGY